MGDHPNAPDPSRLYYLPEQRVDVDDFHAEGHILDVGGGGEGIIGRLKGRRVIAIDLSREELAEAPPGPVKVVMDARELHFLPDTFGAATAFFALMYMADADHPQVFREIHRVLAPGGRFYVWDLLLPPRVDPTRDVAVLPLRVRLPREEVETGYGVLWPEGGREAAHYVRTAREAGFEVLAHSGAPPICTLALLKPEG